MVKPFAIALLFFAPFGTMIRCQTARFEFGVQAYAGVSDLLYRNKSNAPAEDFYNETAVWRFSPGGAVFGRYHFGPRCLLQAGLGYRLSGYRVKEFELFQYTPDFPEGVYLGKAHGTVHYHDLTLDVHLKAKPLKSFPVFYLTSGLSNQFDVGRSQTIVIDYEQGGTSKTTEPLPTTDRDIPFWGLRGDAGFGFEFKAFANARLFIEPIAGFNLTPVIKEKQGKSYQWALGLNLGLVW